MAETTASYTTSFTDTTITFNITKDPEYPYYFVFVRLYDDTSNITYQGWQTESTKTVTGLQPGTRYAVNVGYGKDGQTTWGWCGTGDITTLSDSSSDDSDDDESTPFTWIYDSGAWQKAKPHIYSSGAWHLTKPWTYSGGAWHEPPTI